MRQTKINQMVHHEVTKITKKIQDVISLQFALLRDLRDFVVKFSVFDFAKSQIRG